MAKAFAPFSFYARIAGMALVSCPECQSRISDKARSCSQCGLPILQNSLLVKVTGQSGWTGVSILLIFVFGLLVIALAFVLWWMYPGGESTP